MNELNKQIENLNDMAIAAEDKLDAYLQHRSDLSAEERARGDCQFMNFIEKLRVHKQLLQHARKPIH